MVKAVRQRAEIPVEMTWNLESIFSADEAWEARFVSTTAQLADLRGLQGTLAGSGATFYDALQLRDAVARQVEELYVYANMRFHEDTRRTHYQALTDRALALYTEFSSASAFYTPEILAIPAERLNAWYGEEPRLELYRHQIDDITRARPHVRSAEVEQVLAGTIEMATAPDRLFEMIENADLPPRFPPIQSADGEIKLSLSNYVVLLRGQDREIRRQAFESMHGTFKDFQNTIATNFSSQVKKNLFYARERRYGSALEMALDGNNIPVAVYDTLVQTVEKNLAPLHRYMRLRERVLGLTGDQHMYDLYVSLVPQAQVEIPYAEAREQVIAALGPLGQEYTTPLATGLNSRWIDVYENEGKRGGAYSSGTYTTQPFILLNYQDQMDDMFTLAHELGHSMHSLFTRQHQPYPYGDYTIFLAEIASTFNEALLTQHLLNTTTDKTLRAYIVNHHIEDLRATFYRQTLFAAFEQQVHGRAEAGEPLTPELLCAIYKDLNDRFYGAGGVTVDDLIAWEWSRIPHFYSSFYVYQYATGLAASTALARMVLSEGQPAVDRYLRMLRSGSSRYSIDLLRDAGVDMTTPAPIEAAVAEFDRAVSELESLLA